jgi:hypothetical protein
MKSAKASALKAKLGKVKDYFSGVSRVDNAANPDSAYSRAKKRSEMSGPRKPFDFTAYNNAKSYGKGVGP